MNEKCGIFAAYSLEKEQDVSGYIEKGLSDLQHRGQLSAGISSFSVNRMPYLITFKGLGLVHEVFSSESAQSRDTRGHTGIGHVRYATSGEKRLADAQPFQCESKRRFSFAFNGNIANYKQLLNELKAEGVQIENDLDTEVIMHLIAKGLKQGIPIQEIPRALEAKLDGAYTLVFLDELGNLLVYRDRRGFKPVSYTQKGNLLLIASESSALSSYGSVIHSLAPGQALWLGSEDTNIHVRQIMEPKPAHCFFEYVYFSRSDSNLEGVSVASARSRMGKALAEIEDQLLDENCVVMAVPDTARIVCEGYGQHLGLNRKEGIIRNGGAKRTFIEGGDRKEKIKKKFKLAPELFKEKKVFIVDDSLVRSSTIRILIETIKNQCEAREIHLRIACPPIFSPCFYGIDIPSYKDLFARMHHEPIRRGVLPEDILKAMASDLGVDSIKFLPVESMVDAISLETQHLCQACITANYPTESGQKLADEDLYVARAVGVMNGNSRISENELKIPSA